MRPVVAIYSTFLQRAYDQVIHDVCIQNLPVVFAMDRAGLVGDDGRTHQGVFDIAYLRCLPNMAIMAPKDENELRHMIDTAIAHESGPIAVRYPRGNGFGVAMDAEPTPLPIGKGEVLRDGRRRRADRPRRDRLPPPRRPPMLLAEEGIEAAVINARFAKPLDEALILDAARRCGHVVTIEEKWRRAASARACSNSSRARADHPSPRHGRAGRDDPARLADATARLVRPDGRADGRARAGAARPPAPATADALEAAGRAD